MEILQPPRDGALYLVYNRSTSYVKIGRGALKPYLRTIVLESDIPTKSPHAVLVSTANKKALRHAYQAAVRGVVGLRRIVGHRPVQLPLDLRRVANRAASPAELEAFLEPSPVPDPVQEQAADTPPPPEAEPPTASSPSNVTFHEDAPVEGVEETSEESDHVIEQAVLEEPTAEEPVSEEDPAEDPMEEAPGGPFLSAEAAERVDWGSLMDPDADLGIATLRSWGALFDPPVKGVSKQALRDDIIAAAQAQGYV